MPSSTKTLAIQKLYNNFLRKLSHHRFAQQLHVSGAAALIFLKRYYRFNILVKCTIQDNSVQ